MLARLGRPPIHGLPCRRRGCRRGRRRGVALLGRVRAGGRGTVSQRNMALEIHDGARLGLGTAGAQCSVAVPGALRGPLRAQEGEPARRTLQLSRVWQ